MTKRTAATLLLALISACGVKSPPSPLYSIPMTDTGTSANSDSVTPVKQEETPPTTPAATPSADGFNTKKKKK